MHSVSRDGASLQIYQRILRMDFSRQRIEVGVTSCLALALSSTAGVYLISCFQCCEVGAAVHVSSVHSCESASSLHLLLNHQIAW